MSQIEAKVASLNTTTLKEMAIALFNDNRDEAGIVLSAVLDRLMATLNETDFVNFCAEIEA